MLRRSRRDFGRSASSLAFRVQQSGDQPDHPQRDHLLRPRAQRFGRVTAYSAPFLDDVNIAKAPRMNLSQAVALVRRAGHRGTFFNVTLRNPLGAQRLHAMYIFGFSGTFVGVDTVTKRVHRLADAVGAPGHVKR